MVDTIGNPSKTQRPFNTISAIGAGYGITNTALGITQVLSTTLTLGGKPLLFWGFLLMSVIGLSTAVTLGELCSAIPHPGGQYIWTHRLASPSSRRFLSYTTGMLGWLSAVAMGASGNLSVFLNLNALVVFMKPDFAYKRWMGFVGYQLLNALTLLVACFKYAQPEISKFALFLSCLTMTSISVVLFAMAKEHTKAATLFGGIDNASGWPDGAAFLMGINGLNWSFSCLDVATHLAEEIPDPAANIPRALMWTVAIGFCSGMLLILSIVVNLRTIDVSADNSGIALIHRITNSRAAAVGLWIPVLLCVVSTVWAVQNWQSRLAWTLSREAGFPYHQHLSKIASAPFHTPIWSLVGSAAGTAILGFLYLGSELAFNSLCSTGILLQYLSYSIPVVLCLWRGRSAMEHGPFWFPRLGLVANVVMLAWTVVALVFYCFPISLPVSQERMNYSSVILFAVPLFIASLWFLYAKKTYEVKEMLDE